MSPPNAREYQLAYELLRPAPWNTSPVEHAARLIADHREELVRAVIKVCPLECRAVVVAAMRGEESENAS